jgi:hypothetical protein
MQRISRCSAEALLGATAATPRDAAAIKIKLIAIA